VWRNAGNRAKRGVVAVETWTKVLVLSIGGTLGVNARYWLGAWINRWASPQFPWATVAINVSGSFLIGFLAVALSRWMPHPNVRLLVITGFLGGYTTFSTFENDALTLWERGERILMAANLIGSVAIGFGAVLMGTVLARGLELPAISRAATASGSDRKVTVEESIRVPSAGDGTSSESADGLEGVTGKRVDDGGNQ
jgi:fluoride exporter